MPNRLQVSRIFRVGSELTNRHGAARAILATGFLGVFILGVVLAGMLAPAEAATGIRRTVNFQGKVTNLNGTNVSNGSYSFVFSIYTVSSGGSAVWTETKSLTVTNGIFQTELGDVTTLPGSVDFNTDNIYLGMAFNSDPEMSPRIRFTSVPQAFNSERLGGLTAADFAQLNPGSAQSGSLNVTGSVQAATSLQAPLVDTPTAVALNVGTVTATSVTVGRATSSTNLTLQGSASTTWSATGASGSTTVGFAAPTTTNTITFPNAGGTVCTTVASTCNAVYAPGSAASYIQNQIAAPQAANFFISSASATAGDATAIIRMAAAQTGNPLQVQNSSGNVIAKVDSSGNLGFNGGLSTIDRTSASTDTNDMEIRSGNATGTSSTAGDVIIDVGTSTSGNGSITIGGAARVQPITLGNSTGGAIRVGQNGGTLQLDGTNFDLSTAGVLTVAGGQTRDINTAVASGAGAALVIQPGTSTGASSNGGATTLRGGDGSGTTTVVGGALTLQGGSATGGSGTRTGGAVILDAGFGGSAGTNGGTVTIGGTNAASTTIGRATSTTNLTLQGSASTTWSATSASGTTTVGFTSPTTTNSISFPNAGGTVCTTVSSTCSSVYQTVSGSGAYVQFAPTASQDDSSSNTTVWVNKTSGTGSILRVQRSGNDALVVSNAGATTVTGPNAGSGTALTVGTGATSNVGLLVSGVASQTADLVRVTANGVTDPLFSVGTTGSSVHRNSSNSTTAFQVQNSNGTAVLNTDTTNARVTVNGTVDSQYGGLGLLGNLLTYSEQFDNAAWTKTNVAATANEAGSNPAPDTTTTADRLVSSAANATVQQTHTTTTNGNYTFSVWVKTNSGTQPIDLRIDSTGATPTTGTASSFTATTTWQRFSVTQNFTGTPSNIRPTLVITNNSATVVAWGGQMTTGTSPVSYTRSLISAITQTTGLTVGPLQVDTTSNKFLMQVNNATDAFLVKDNANFQRLAVDTTNGRVVVGHIGSSLSGRVTFASDTFGDAESISLTPVAGNLTANRTISLPDLDGTVVVAQSAGPGTAQTGNINLSGLGTFGGGLSVTGAAVSLNASSNFATSINTGTSTGSVTIGGGVSTSGAVLIQGNSTSTFTGTNATGTTALGFAAPSTAGTVTYQLPAGGTGGNTYGVCTTFVVCTGYAASNATGYLAKNAMDTSSFAVTASGNLYSFTNSGSAVASGVLSLDNGSNTNSTLSVVASGNPGANQALIYANNSNGAPSGNLLDLRSGGTSRLAVNSSGSVTLASGQTINSSSGTMGIGTAGTTTMTLGRSGQTAQFDGFLQANQSIYVTGALTTSTFKMQLDGVVQSTNTSSLYGIQNQVDFDPEGASLSNIYGFVNLPNVQNSAVNVTQMSGMTAGVQTAATYTGQITTATALNLSGPSIAGTQLFPTYQGINISTNSGNTGNTTGNIVNYQLRVRDTTAAAGSGGTMDNYGIHLTVPSGSGAGTTSNYGLYIDGNGAGTTPYSLYNNSTALSHFVGRLTVASLVDANVTNQTLAVTSTSNTTSALTVTNNTATTNAAALATVSSSSLTTGTALAVDASALTSGAGVAITGGAATTGNVLRVTTASTGNSTSGLVRFNFTGDHTSEGFQIDDATTAGNVMALQAPSLTTGNGLLLTHSGTTLTGNLLQVQSASTSAYTNGAVRFNFNAAHTGNGFQIDSSTAGGTMAAFRANSLVGGTGLEVSSSGTGGVGNILRVSSASTGAPANGLIRFNLTGAHTNNGFQLDDATQTGTAAALNASALTTGNLLSLTAGAATVTTGNTLAVTNGRSNFTPTMTVASAAGAVWDGLNVAATTATFTAANAVTTANGFNLMSINAPTITAGSAVAVTNAATVMISGAPIAAGSATITNADALRVVSGQTRLGGNLLIDTGSSPIALQVKTSSGTSQLLTADQSTSRVTVGGTGNCTGVGQGRFCVNQSATAAATTVVTQNNTMTVSGAATGSQYASIINVTDTTASGANTSYGLHMDFTGTTNDSATQNGITVLGRTQNAGNLINLQAGGASVFSVSNAGVTQVGGSAGTGAFVNNGSTANTALALGDLATGNMGASAAATVDAYTSFTISPTASGRSYTILAPTSAGAGRVIYVSNINGSNSFTLVGNSSVLMNPGVTATLVWNGSAWTFAGTDSSNLQAAYNNSTDPEITLGTAATAGITVRDNATPISGNLLEVQNNGGTVDYLAVTSAASTITGNLLFTREAARTIQINDSTTAGAAGGALTVKAAAGNTSGLGGNLALAAGAGGNAAAGGVASLTGGASGGGATAGGAVTVQGGAGNAGTAGSNGGAASLLGGAAGNFGTGGVGGNVTVTGGASFGSAANAGGTVAVQGGQGSPTGAGGAVTLQGGSGGSTSGAGGLATLRGGNATAGNSAGGNVSILGGTATGTGAASTISITSGAAAGATIAGGALNITSGAGNTTGAGGLLTVLGGQGGATGIGGGVTMRAGSGGATSGAGGVLTLQGGNATAGNSAGGNVSILGGTATGTGAASTVSVTSGAAAGATIAGGALNITSGAGNTTGAGGLLTVLGGQGGATGIGGGVTVRAGSGGATSGAGGVLTLQGGNATASNSAGGAVSLVGGTATGTGAGGALTLTGGVASATAGSLGGVVTINGGAGSATGVGAAGSAVNINGGAAGGTNANAGGAVTITAGTASGAGTGGTATLQGGAAAAVAGSAGGGVAINGRDGSATGTGGIGGTVTIKAGDALGSGANAGGNIQLTAGNASSTGTPGVVQIDTPVFTNVNQTFTQTGNGQAFPAAGAETTTLQSNVDGFSTLTFNVTGAFTGSTITVPNPRNTATGRVVYVAVANGSVSFTLAAAGMKSILMSQNSTAMLVWNGFAWTGNAAATSLQDVYNNTSSSPASIVTTSTTKNLLFQAGVGFDNSNVFQVGNSNAAPVIAVDTTNTATGANLAANSGIETGGTPPTSWSTVGTVVSLTQNTTASNLASGVGSLDISLAAAGGAANALSGTLATSSVYNVSFNIKSSGTAPTLVVEYYRDSSTFDATCSTPTNGTINSTNFFKYTCTFTTTATAKSSSNQLRIRQSDTGTRNLYIDNVSVTLQNSTGAQNTGVLQVGGPLSQGLTLFTLDSFAGTPFTGAGNTALLGSMFYDTTLGRIQCYESDGWGACGAAQDNNVIMVPEYASAVLNVGTAGDTHIGAMTANMCSGSSRFAIDTALCSSAEEYSYYRWTSGPNATLQTYSIFARYQLPVTFKNFFDANTVTVTGRVSSVTDAAVAYSMWGSTGLQCGSSSTNVASSANVWTTTPITVDETTCGGSPTPGVVGFSPGSVITFKIDMSARNNANAYVSNIQFTMKGK